jgi:hypothetical protein
MQRLGAHRESLRRLITAWVLHCPSSSDNSLQHRLAIAAANQLPEILPLAISIAKRQGNFQDLGIANRLRALLLVGQMGGEELVDSIEPLLNDKTVCLSREIVARRTPAAPDIDVEMRDVALNVLLRMTRQSATEYGYPHAAPPNAQDINGVMMMFPRTAAERESAIAKWRQWRTTAAAKKQAGEKSGTDTAGKQ